MTGSTAKLRSAEGRKIRLCVYIFLQCSLILGAPVSAQEKRVETIGLSNAVLYKFCAEEAPACAAYIAGVIDTAILNHTLFSERRDRGFVGPGQISFCFPEEILDENPAELFMEFVEDNPDQRGFSAAEGVLLALNDRFPCTPGEIQ